MMQLVMEEIIYSVGIILQNPGLLIRDSLFYSKREEETHKA